MQTNDKVVQIGQVDDGDGYDYALAFIDRSSGDVTYQQTTLYNFEAKYAENTDTIINGSGYEYNLQSLSRCHYLLEM